MKKIYSILASFSAVLGFAQAGAPAPYYNGFNWTLTGIPLKTALATKITTTHTRILSYAQAENAIRFTDLDPDDTSNTNLLLLYGFSNNICPTSQADDNDHRRRNKNSDGGGQLCEWNREHTYARSLGTPNLENSAGPNADVHHLRAADVARNGMRDSDRFFDGSGNSFESGLLWYPGDEWKGDVARMMMYMYLRYGNQCLPTGVAQLGISTVSSDSNMVQLFLEWNAEDPVSTYEDNRNTYLGATSNTYGQGNRNPFIDNPYLATLIWGGPVAENRWPFLSTQKFDLLASVNVYPNPSNNHRINIETKEVLDKVQLISINGQLMQQIQNPSAHNNIYTLENLSSGFYFLKINSKNQSTTKKVIIN